MVTETLAPPPLGTLLGLMLPARVVRGVGLSSLYVTLWPGTKLAIEPLSVVGRLVSVVEELKEGVVEATLTLEDLALSAPSQLPCFGVTEYFQVPDGTALSVQVRAETAPEQLDSTFCETSLAS